MTSPLPLSPPLVFEDFAVGQRFSAGSVVVTAESIIAFARQFDPQPFHVDPEAAKASFFGSHVASGWQTACLTMRLMVESGLQVEGGLIGANGEIRWPRPVYPGDRLSVEIEVVDLHSSRSRPDRAFVTVRAETRNEASDLVQVMTARLTVPRRGALSP